MRIAEGSQPQFMHLSSIPISDSPRAARRQLSPPFHLSSSREYSRLLHPAIWAKIWHAVVDRTARDGKHPWHHEFIGRNTTDRP
jgi:hypothetical protein